MIRKPLGRGLGALIDSTAFESAAPPSNGARANTSITMAPATRISAGQFQPRRNFDAERLAELTRAIQSQGIIEPLIVRVVGNPDDFEGPRYELIAGERRLRAARAAGLETVPVIVRDLDDRAALEMSLVENLAREELNAVEEGHAFARLSREFSLSHDEIARRIGKSRPYVSNAIRLLDLPPTILEMIGAGLLNAGQARPLLALSANEARIEAARQIIDSSMTARQAEAIASAHRKRSLSGTRESMRGSVSSDPNLAALIETLQRALKRKVRVVRRRGKSPGRIELDYYDENDLTALAAMLTGASRQVSAHA